MPWTQTRFDGLDALTFCQGRWRITAVSEMGPRIAFLGDEKTCSTGARTAWSGETGGCTAAIAYG